MFLETATLPWKLAFPVSITMSSTVAERSVTATAPATSADGWVGGGADNCIRFIPLSSSTSILTGVRCIGWDRYQKNATDTIWVPTLLCQADFTPHGSVAIPTGMADRTLYPSITITVNSGSANARVITTTSTYKSIASLVVDTLGSELVELVATSASGTPYGNFLMKTL